MHPPLVQPQGKEPRRAVPEVLGALWLRDAGDAVPGPVHEGAGRRKAPNIRYNQYTRKFSGDQQAGEERLLVEGDQQDRAFHRTTHCKHLFVVLKNLYRITSQLSYRFCLSKSWGNIQILKFSLQKNNPFQILSSYKVIDLTLTKGAI